MEEYGFVYIWYDRKHKRYYVGCHWGYIDDGYICSSSWMKSAYNRRPNDFKRRIIAVVYTNKKDLLVEEYKWLSMTKKEELGKKYYNMYNHEFGHWSTKEDSLSIKKRMSKNHRSKNGYPPPRLGKNISLREDCLSKLKGDNRTPNQKRASEEKAKMLTGRKWYTNGVENVLSHEQPEGWKSGKTHRKNKSVGDH